MDDLIYTNITVAIYDHEKLRSDELIGQIKLGTSAIQDAETDLWEKCINSPDVIVTSWLYLLENDDIK